MGAYYRTSIEIFKNKPILGNGLKSFRYQCHKYQDIVKHERFSNCSTHPHNFYLEILIDTGIFGLTFFVFVIFLIFFDFFKKYKYKKTDIQRVIIFSLFVGFIFPFKPTGSIFSTWIGGLYFLLIGFYFFVSRKKNEILELIIFMRNSIIVTTHFFNNYLPQILLIFFFLSGQLDLGPKLFVGCGFILLITTTFSSNKRSIIFSKFTKNLFLETISVRIDISLVITLFLLVIYGFFDIFEFFYLIVFFSILIRWVNEIILSYFELTKIKYPNIFFLICDFVFYFILFSNLILDLEINIKFFLALLNILNIILISIQLWRIKFKKKNRTLKILLSDITNLSFLSSLSLSLSNQLWKILIFFFSGATLSGIYFTAFYWLHFQVLFK